MDVLFSSTTIHCLRDFMSEKHPVSTGDKIKIERTINGWRATVSGADNGWHGGKPNHDFPTFDELIDYLKSDFRLS
jgi:hypothetical protein